MAVSITSTLTKAKELLQGKGLMAHPIHVAINHAPLGLWEGGIAFDFLSQTKGRHKLAEGGYYLNLFGIWTALPTALTGLAEFWDIPSDHPAWRVTLLHATLNDAALGLALYNWWTRRDRRGFAPDRKNLYADGALLAILGLSGYLGGVIAHEYGYGTHRQGSAIAKEHESLVGPQDEIDQPKIVLSDDRPAAGSTDSMAGVAAGEVGERDAAVEQAMAQPDDTREIGGTGI